VRPGSLREKPRMAIKRFGKARPSGQPSSATERKIRILLELIRNKSVRLSRLCDDYGASTRSILRDFQELRKIGARAGFALSDEVEHDRMALKSFDTRPTSLDQGGKALRTLIRSAAKALGKPVEQQLETLHDGEERQDRRFLRFMMPTLREGTYVADVFKALDGAWRANARVRFRYAGKRDERRVEPYAVLQHSGRYYLLGRDLAARDHGWRHFALDQIRTPIARIGTFAPREVPEEYGNDDALGWITAGKRCDVSVWLSPRIAPSATSRVWQRTQRIEGCDDGSAIITFNVSDIDEVIRWAFGFAAEAQVVAPQSAVARARELVEAMGKRYK
jgi:predicted DNA-binding transcriptional regulator YafY